MVRAVVACAVVLTSVVLVGCNAPAAHFATVRETPPESVGWRLVEVGDADFSAEGRWALVEHKLDSTPAQSSLLGLADPAPEEWFMLRRGPAGRCTRYIYAGVWSAESVFGDEGPLDEYAAAAELLEGDLGGEPEIEIAILGSYWSLVVAQRGGREAGVFCNVQPRDSREPLQSPPTHVVMSPAEVNAWLRRLPSEADVRGW